MIALVFGLGLVALTNNYPIAVRVALLVAIFAFGWFEAEIIRSRAAACMTWITGLGALAFWISNPTTEFRILVAMVVFLAGVVLMIAYCRRPIHRS